MHRFKTTLAVAVTALLFGAFALAQGKTIIQGKDTSGNVKDVIVTSGGVLNISSTTLALDATLTGGTARTKVTDGTTNVAVKAASTAVATTDPALVVAVSPNATVLTNPAAQTSSTQTEVLVLTTSTLVPGTGLSGRRAVEVQNIGPYSIYCSPGTPTASKSRKIATGESWAIDASDAVVLRCLADTANQVTGAATIVTEIK
jgi:hypothetical protein